MVFRAIVGRVEGARCCSCCCGRPANHATLAVDVPADFNMPASNHLPTTTTLIHSPTSHSEPTVHRRIRAAVTAQASSTLTHRGMVHHSSYTVRQRLAAAQVLLQVATFWYMAPTVPTCAPGISVTPIHILKLTTHIHRRPHHSHITAIVLVVPFQVSTPASNHLPTTTTLIHSPTSHSEPTVHRCMNAAVTTQASSTLTHRGMVHHSSYTARQRLAPRQVLLHARLVLGQRGSSTMPAYVLRVVIRCKLGFDSCRNC